MIASLTLTSIAPIMAKLLTPDYFTKNTCLFKDNFLHEMPHDVQIAIMGEVKLLDEKELERKQDLEETIAVYVTSSGGEAEDIVARAISNILWELKLRISDDDDDDKYQDLLHTLIDEECNNEGFGEMGKTEQMEIVVNWVGVMDLLKSIVEEYGVNITDYTSNELYAKCYYQYFYNILKKDFSCEDIKLIQKYNINVLINDE